MEDYLEPAICIASNLVVSYHLINGNLVPAMMIPITGTAYLGLGYRFDRETISTLGKSILLGTMFSLPGSAPGYYIQSLASDSTIAAVAANTASAALSYFSYHKLMDFVLYHATY